jgi:hypothetical protein
MDESERDRHYYLCVAIVDPGQLAKMRKQLMCWLMQGQRELHFKQEKPIRRRLLADRLAKLPVDVRIYVTSCARTRMESARQRCLQHAMRDLLAIGTHRLVIDSRLEQDRNDRATIHHMLTNEPARLTFTYEHMDSAQEPLCWIADATGWCYGAGGDWRQRIMPIIGDVTMM